MLQLLNKDNPRGPLSEPVQEANSFVSDPKINSALAHSGYAARGFSAWGWKGREKKELRDPSVVTVKPCH